MSEEVFAVVFAQANTLMGNMVTFFNSCRVWLRGIGNLIVSQPIMLLYFGIVILGISIAVFGKLLGRD